MNQYLLTYHDWQFWVHVITQCVKGGHIIRNIESSSVYYE